jgi:hypothetical protein
MVYLDYEIAPSNRVFEQRIKGRSLEKRMKAVRGHNFFTLGMKYSILFGSFGYFLKRFYIPGHVISNAASILIALSMSNYLAHQYDAINLLTIGDVNEFFDLTENNRKTSQLFSFIEYQEANKLFNKY